MRYKKITSFILILILVISLCPITAKAEKAASSDPGVLPSTLDMDSVPEYAGEDYIVLNDNVPDFYLWQITKKSYVSFSPLDNLGRTGPAMACLGKETLSNKSRSSASSVQPSGWHNEKYDLIEDQYLYNRAHVIAFMLSGDSNSPENLFTGTQYMNTGSMLQFESLISSYIEKTGNHVVYRASPCYREDDLVATGIQLEAWSVEDSGEGLCFNVFVYNVQPGILIDYKTGESEIDPDYIAEDADSVIPILVMGDVSGTVPDRSLDSSETDEDDEDAEPVVTYILNTNTKKFHKPSCSSVQDMKEKNKREFYGTREEAIQEGYQPCGKCHP